MGFRTPSAIIRGLDAGFSCISAWVGKGIREPPHSVRGNSRPAPRVIVTEAASYPAMTDTFERLKAALAGRYTIERESMLEG